MRGLTAKAALAAVALLLIGAIACAMFAYGTLQNCQRQLEMAFRVKAPPLFARMSPIEQKAVTEWAALNGKPVQGVLMGRQISVLDMGARRCVALVLERGALGGSPVYCFDKAGKLVERYDQVE